VTAAPLETEPDAIPYWTGPQHGPGHHNCLRVRVRCPACGRDNGHGIAIPPCPAAESNGGWNSYRLGSCGHGYRLVPPKLIAV